MNKKLTQIVAILDRSGSMGGFEDDTIGGFNSFIENQSKEEGEVKLTTVLFDDKYEVLWNGVDAKNVRLTKNEYFVRGSTALLDAIGKAINDLGFSLAKTKEEHRAAKVIFVITTDGYENASNEFTYTKIKEMIQHQREKYNWDFIFLAANLDAKEEAENLGIDEKLAFNYKHSREGIFTCYKMMDENVKCLRDL